MPPGVVVFPAGMNWSPPRAVAIAFAGAAVVASGLSLSRPAEAGPRPYGDVRFVAQVPDPPGFPEGIAVDGDTVYVAGPATLGTAGKPPSAVVAFDRHTGAQTDYFAVTGEDLSQEHANSSIAFAADGLYVINTQLGIYRLDPQDGSQHKYSAPFPDLRPCAPLIGPPPCSPTLVDAPPIPNDMVFDDKGTAYVTDSTQATIWRVPTGGGTPTIWFQDLRLASPYIGVNGVRIDPSGQYLYASVTTDLEGMGRIYRLPLVAGPAAADLELVHTYGADNHLPDGIAFGAKGHLYVAMAGPGTSGVSVLDAAGTQVARLGNAALSPIGPYDSPANIAFTGDGSIVLSNHAFATGLALPAQFSIIDVFVDDEGLALHRPVLT